MHGITHAIVKGEHFPFEGSVHIYSSSQYRIPGNFYVGLFLRFGTKDFTNLNFCEKASDQWKQHPCNTQLINPSRHIHRATPIKLYGAMMKEEIASYKFDYCMRGLKKYGSQILMTF